MRPILLLFSICFLLSSLHSQTTEELSKEIGKIIQFDTDVTFERTPGWIIGVLYQDSMYVMEFGSMDKRAEIPATDSTLFELGGTSKIFTASLVEVLCEKGLMHPDSSLNFYLGPKLANPQNQFITIRDLVQHTACLPRMPLEFGIKESDPSNPYAYYHKSDLIEFYQKYPCFPIKKKSYSYSHVNYALLEVAMEQHLQKQFSKLLAEHLLKPLGMHDTGVFLPIKNKLANGYSISGLKVNPWEFSSFAASEGVKSNVHDLLKYAKANLDNSSSSISPALYKTHEIAYPTGITKNTYIASGWHATKHKRYYNSLIHSGTTAGHRSFIGLVKETNTAVVILSNSEYEMGGLGYLILRMLNNNWKKSKHMQ